MAQTTPSSEIKWIEVDSSAREEIFALAQAYKIHPLAVEDCLNRNQRAKFEDFEAHQLLVWFVYLNDETIEFEFVIFPHVLILVTNQKPPGNVSWREYLRVKMDHKDVYHMLYQAIDHSLDVSMGQIQPVGEAIEAFEQNLFRNSPSDPRKLMRMKQRLARGEFTVSYLASVVAQLQQYLHPKDDLRWRLRDLMDHCERIHQLIRFYQTQIGASIEMYWGMTAKKTNDQIKKLTLVASVSVPLTFWSSFWGMNFEKIPFHSDRLFYLALFIMLCSAILVYLMLRMKGYWEHSKN